MQDIREIKLRDSGSNANTDVCFEVQATALRPRLHTEWFPLCPHRTSHKGNLQRGICNYKVRSTELLSLTQPPLHKRQGTKPKQQSPLHKRDKGTKPNSTTITSTQEGQGTKPNTNLNHLYTWGTRHKAKIKKRLQTWWSQETTNNSWWSQ